MMNIYPSVQTPFALYTCISIIPVTVYFAQKEPLPLKWERVVPNLLYVAAWQLLNQLDSKILLQLAFVLGRRRAGFVCPDIWYSSIPVWQLPESWQRIYFISDLLTQATKPPK
jgi:hypothetical protein